MLQQATQETLVNWFMGGSNVIWFRYVMVYGIVCVMSCEEAKCCYINVDINIFCRFSLSKINCCISILGYKDDIKRF